MSYIAIKNSLSEDRLFFMVPRAGVEPATLSLGRICSIQLSYRGVGLLYYSLAWSVEAFFNASTVRLCLSSELFVQRVIFVYLGVGEPVSNLFFSFGWVT